MIPSYLKTQWLKKNRGTERLSQTNITNPAIHKTQLQTTVDVAQNADSARLERWNEIC